MPEHTHAVVEIPRSPRLFACFSGAPDGEDPVLSLVQRLLRQHDEQWCAEDVARLATDDTALAGVKRRIDQMNETRCRLVDELDAWLIDALVQSQQAPLHTETLGSVIDRLCIAWVRAERTSQTAGPSSRARRARHQLRELAHAYDFLVEEVAAGHRRTPDWRALKSYGEGHHGE